MASVAITAVDRYTSLVEYTGATMDALNEYFEVTAHSSSYTFAATVTSSANFKLALECSCNGTWFTIDTSKTISNAGEYVYFYTGSPAAKIRMRISQITSGTPNLVPHIAVAYHG
jgi:hypothetical protein